MNLNGPNVNPLLNAEPLEDCIIILDDLYVIKQLIEKSERLGYLLESETKEIIYIRKKIEKIINRMIKNK
jgi:hypothetical protein